MSSLQPNWRLMIISPKLAPVGHLNTGNREPLPRPGVLDRYDGAALRRLISHHCLNALAVPQVLGSTPSDLAASQRSMEFNLGWAADPIYFGDYPASMRQRVGRRLPAFTPEQSG